MFTRPRTLSVVLATLFLVLTTALASRAQAGNLAEGNRSSAKIDSQLWAALRTQDAGDFFIIMAEKADLSPAYALSTKAAKGEFVFNALRATAERTQKGVRDQLARQGVAFQPFYISNKIYVPAGNLSLALALAERADVARLTPNRTFQLQEPIVEPNDGSHIDAIESNLTFVKAPQLWALGYTGVGAVLAGNDTGLIWDHPAIKPHYRGWDGVSANHNYNWWDATGVYTTAPADGNGHGTHTTGTMVGDDGGANKIGMAPGAKTIHCKNITDWGTGDDTTFTECFQWDLAPWDLTGNNPDPSKAPDAINNSWGYWGGNQPQFEDEIAALQAAGIAVEVSAGNEGPSCATLRSPGDYLAVMTTGSVQHTDPYPGTITSFSSRGPSDLYPGEYFPDVMAPGQNIRSAWPVGGYLNLSGTSMSGPHVTALIGLIWSAAPALQGDVVQTFNIIRDTAAPLTGQTGSNCGGNYYFGPNDDWGHGTINALAAVQEAIAATSPAFDAWIEDTDYDTVGPVDNGYEPSTGTSLWKSRGIWVRQNCDNGVIPQDPEYGQQNCVYVKVFNNGPYAFPPQIANGMLELYWADASVGLSWPTQWTLIDSVAISNLAAGGTVTLGAPWWPAGVGHYCLIARIVSAGDPIGTNSSWIPTYTQFNNNVAWRNVNVVNLNPFAPFNDVEFILRNVAEGADMVDLWLGPANLKERSFLEQGKVTVRLTPEVFQRWVANGAQGYGFEIVEENTLTLIDVNGARLNGIPLAYEEAHPVQMTLAVNPDISAETVYHFDAVQYARGEMVGGVGYEITVEPAAAPISDLGDAPDSTNHSGAAMPAYPGVAAQFPTVFDDAIPGPLHQAPLADAWLGGRASLENEADLPPDQDGMTNIDPLAGAANQDFFDDGVNAAGVVIPQCAKTQLSYTLSVVGPKVNRYVNVWFDFNRDGDWNDSYRCMQGTKRVVVREWAVQNRAVSRGPGVYTLNTPQFMADAPPSPDRPLWMRITLSDTLAPTAGDGRGPSQGYRFGETEDYYLTEQ